jgi:pimeloyl-ACP methyl ester carboxylesterase
MQRSRQDGTVGVSGGRLLSYRGYGPADGQPVLFFPGTPGSAVEWSMWPSGSAERSGIRVIAVDKPGLGWSDWQPRRRVLDWPVDVTALADALGLQRFAVLGYSGGVPYALACVQLLPDRVSAVTLVGCVGPDEEPGCSNTVTATPHRASVTASANPTGRQTVAGARRSFATEVRSGSIDVVGLNRHGFHAVPF